MSIDGKEDEISLLDVVEKLITFFQLLRRRALLLIVLTLIGASIGYIVGSFQTTKYIAESSFIIDNGGQNGPTGLMSMAAQFGIGGGTTNGIDENKLVDITKTNAIIRKVLLNEFDDVLLIDYIVDNCGFKESWQERNENYQSIDFSKPGLKRDQLLNEVISKVRHQWMNISMLKSGVVYLKVESPNEKASYYLNTSIIEALKKFFEAKTTKKNKIAYQKIKSEVDSIRNVLKDTEEEYALVVDNSFGIVKAKGRLRELRLKRDLEILNVMYSEGVKNLEMAKFNMLESASFLHLIDRSVLPLPVAVISKVILSVLLAVLFFFFGLIFIVLQNLWLGVRGQIREKNLSI